MCCVYKNRFSRFCTFICDLFFFFSSLTIKQHLIVIGWPVKRFFPAVWHCILLFILGLDWLKVSCCCIMGEDSCEACCFWSWWGNEGQRVKVCVSQFTTSIGFSVWWWLYWLKWGIKIQYIYLLYFVKTPQNIALIFGLITINFLSL